MTYLHGQERRRGSGEDGNSKQNMRREREKKKLVQLSITTVCLKDSKLLNRHKRI